jgi:MoaA/NifB/PqqE/SkfB family radical SAM enzyme/spore coat polysaccharide biosynthesis protein SpsF (cytidylyltransferase family)
MQDWERLLAECQGRTLLEILVARLRRIHGLREVYLFAEDALARPRLVHQAGRLGVRVLHRSPSALGTWLGLAWRCLRAGVIVRVREDSPFMDPEVADLLISRLIGKNADCTYAVEFPQGLAPSQVVAPRFVLKTVLKNLKKVFRPGLAVAMRNVLRQGRTEYLRMSEMHDAPAVAQAFIMNMPDEVTMIAELYGALGLDQFGLKDVARLYADEEGLIRHLTEQRGRSRAPHLVNAVLNRYEAQKGRVALHSYPVSVGFNIMPICNVDCQFCSFSPQEMVTRKGVTLEEFKQLDWLQYVSELALWGGVGESLINPEFPAIFNYARERFPHLKIGLSTIGKSLLPRISDQLVGRLSFLNVSLNAATKDTHAKIVKAGQFDRVIDNVRYFMTQRKARETQLPRVHLSMVIMRENVEEMPGFIDLAADLGVDTAVFSHYLSTTIEGHRKSPEESSLYFHKDLTDRMIIKTKERAAELGVNVFLPPLFSDTDCSILFSARSEAGPSGDCFEPWRACYLSIDEQGRRQMLFCCSGMYLRAFYDVKHLDDAHFMRSIWNGPIPQHFRRTTNSQAGNPLCSFCKTEDRFDPANKKIYEIDRVFGHELELLGGESAFTQFVNVTKSPL